MLWIWELYSNWFVNTVNKKGECPINQFIFFFIIIFIVGIILELGLRKKLKIEKSRGFIYKGVNKAHIVIELTMLGVFLILLWYYERPFPAFITFFFVLFSFRAFMEWKFEREKKNYIMTLFNIVMYLAIIAMALVLNII